MEWIPIFLGIAVGLSVYAAWGVKQNTVNPIDAYGENQKGYQPRKPKRKDGQQIRMEGL